MKKKLLAIIAAVAMIATLLVPMLSVSAESPKLVISFDTAVEGTELKVSVNIAENTGNVFVGKITLDYDEALQATFFEPGDISDTYDSGRGGIKTFGFNYTENLAEASVLVDSNWTTLDKDGNCYGVTTTGCIGTFYFAKKDGSAVTAADAFDFGVAAADVVCFDQTISFEVSVLCKHTAVEEVIVKEAECEVAGEKKTVCKACGEDVETGIAIPATGHDMKEAPGTSADCTHGGTVVKECANGCGKTEVTESAPLGHDWVVDEAASVAATCTTDGKKVEVCSRACGVEAKETVLEKLGHGATKDNITLEPTCEEKGSKDVICTVCDAVIDTVEIAALGHDWVEDLEKRENPTLEKEGKQVFECSRECGVAAKEEVVAKLEGEVKNEEAGFVVKTEEEGKGLPADIAPVEKEAPAADKIPEGLKAVTSIVFDTDFSDLVKDVVAEIVIDLSKYLDVKDYNTVSIGVLKDGKVEVIEATFDGSKVTFNGNVDGEIVLLVEDKVEEEVKPEATKPGDNFTTVLYIAFALVAAAGVVVIGKKRVSL